MANRKKKRTKLSKLFSLEGFVIKNKSSPMLVGVCSAYKMSLRFGENSNQSK